MHPASAPRPWLANPIRLSGLLAVALLAAPGSFAGVALLLSYAQAPVSLPLVPAAVHGELQLLGFFLVLIWGFLVRGMPGMLGADPRRTATVRHWMVVLAAGLLLRWLGALFGVTLLERAGVAATVTATAAGSGVLVAAALRGTHDWREMPFPVLLAGLVLAPAALLAGFIPGVAANDLLLRGSVVPVVLAMGYRIFSAMARLAHPRPRPFGVGAALWFAGSLLRAAAVAPLAAAVVGLLGVLLVSHSLGVWRPLRRLAVRKHPAVDAALVLYVRAAFVFWLLGAAVDLAVAGGGLAGAYFWNDFARHALTIGFGLVLVMGLTQRIFPTFLRGRPASAAWMRLNLALVAAGLLLRAGEPFLPAAGGLVAASALLTYAGVLAYAAHLLRSLLARTAATATTR